MPERQTPAVTVTKHEVELDPSISVFNVVLQNESGTWYETWGTEGELRAFLRGVKAACELLGRYSFPDVEIPREPTSRFHETRLL